MTQSRQRRQTRRLIQLQIQPIRRSLAQALPNRSIQTRARQPLKQKIEQIILARGDIDHLHTSAPQPTPSPASLAVASRLPASKISRRRSPGSA